jgi:23S rRNA (adenine2503-C2)-methyltransferase
MEHQKQNILGLNLFELEAALLEMGEKKFRAKQIWQWIFKKGISDFALMSSLGKDLQSKLAEKFECVRPSSAKRLDSVDGTVKWLLQFEDCNKAEAVFISEVVPGQDKGALCVSSQVGCTLTCSFCHTGTQKLVRNLHAHEIVGQFMLARDELEEWNLDESARRLTNIVMMGMGEPLFNYENVAKALRIITDSDGIGWSKRRITLSTSGVVPMIEKCGAELGVNLAVSLHAVRDDLRNILVPLNKKYPIAQLLEACRNYPGLSNSRRITFEYVMLKGVNDSDEDAEELAFLLKDIPCKINLIPFNPWPGTNYECSSNNRIHKFQDILTRCYMTAPIRTPRGRDILAACGQLKSESERVGKVLL